MTSAQSCCELSGVKLYLRENMLDWEKECRQGLPATGVEHLIMFGRTAPLSHRDVGNAQSVRSP